MTSNMTSNMTKQFALFLLMVLISCLLQAFLFSVISELLPWNEPNSGITHKVFAVLVPLIFFSGIFVWRRSLAIALGLALSALVGLLLAVVYMLQDAG